MRDGAAAPPEGPARRRRWRMATWLAAAMLTVLAAAAPASAQSDAEFRNQIRNLNAQVASLRAQLSDLERTVHTGTERRTGAAAPDGGVGERNSRRLSELETDIDEAREWRRRVAGRFEEVDNRIVRLENRIERLVADVDFRLTALEKQGRAPAAAASADRAPQGEPATGNRATVAPGRDGGYEPSAAPRNLGTIPADEPSAAPPPGQTPEEQYKAAFALLEAARYDEAHEALSRFIEANPAHPLAQNAAYWRSETLFARQMYAEAARAYALNLRQYPDGRKAPDNMVKLGLALLKLGRDEEACRTFAQLDQIFPDPPLNIRRAAQQGRRQANCP